MATDPKRTAVRIAVIVVRTGGIANLRREWKAEPPPAAAPRWAALLDDCPWDDDPPATTGGDRFVWSVQAWRDRDERQARFGDAQLTGAWRALVDAVRDFADGPSPRASG